MTGIRVNCGFCAIETVMTPASVRLTLHDNGAGHYEWSCPGCGSFNARRADRRARALLSLARAPITYARVPAEFLEPKVGPVLTEDDLLDFSKSFRSWCRTESAWQESDLRRTR